MMAPSHVVNKGFQGREKEIRILQRYKHFEV